MSIAGIPQKYPNYIYRDRLSQHASRMDWRSFNLNLLGTTERLDAWRVMNEEIDKPGKQEADGVFTVRSHDDKRWDSHLKARNETESEFDKSLKPRRDEQIKAYEKATEAALEKILANVAVLLGIILATALAPWTSFQTRNAVAAQLGSYALLLSVATGLMALVSSITQLTNATECARRLLLFQEKLIAAGELTHKDDKVSTDTAFWEGPSHSFSKGIIGEVHLTTFHLFWWGNLHEKLYSLVYGPAILLIPVSRRELRVARKTSLSYNVHGTEICHYANQPHWLRPLSRRIPFEPPTTD